VLPCLLLLYSSVFVDDYDRDRMPDRDRDRYSDRYISILIAVYITFLFPVVNGTGLWSSKSAVIQC